MWMMYKQTCQSVKATLININGRHINKFVVSGVFGFPLMFDKGGGLLHLNHVWCVWFDIRNLFTFHYCGKTVLIAGVFNDVHI